MHYNRTIFHSYPPPHKHILTHMMSIKLRVSAEVEPDMCHREAAESRKPRNNVLTHSDVTTVTSDVSKLSDVSKI